MRIVRKPVRVTVASAPATAFETPVPPTEPAPPSVEVPVAPLVPEEPIVHTPEANVPLRAVVEDAHQSEPQVTNRMYRAKGFILRIDGENGMSVSRDDGSAAGAEPWKNGGIVQLVHGQSHMYIAIVVDTEDKPAVSDEPTVGEPETPPEQAEPSKESTGANE